LPFGIAINFSGKRFESGGQQDCQCPETSPSNKNRIKVKDQKSERQRHLKSFASLLGCFVVIGFGIWFWFWFLYWNWDDLCPAHKKTNKNFKRYPDSSTEMTVSDPSKPDT